MAFTKEDIQKRSDEIHNYEYLILGNYIDINTKCLTLHKKCGYEWEMNLNNHVYKKKGCPDCYGNSKLTTNKINKIISPFKVLDINEDRLSIEHAL